MLEQPPNRRPWCRSNGCNSWKTAVEVWPSNRP